MMQQNQRKKFTCLIAVTLALTQLLMDLQQILPVCDKLRRKTKTAICLRNPEVVFVGFSLISPMSDKDFLVTSAALMRAERGAAAGHLNWA